MDLNQLTRIKVISGLADSDFFIQDKIQQQFFLNPKYQ